MRIAAKTRKEKKGKKRKRSRLSLRRTNSSLHENEAQMEQTPPDKGAKLEKRSSKQKLPVGHGERMEVEYEENVEGVLKYLGWIKGTVMDYDKVNEYLVQFPDDMDWIKSLNSKDVSIIE